MRENRTSGSMSGSEKPSHGRAIEPLPEETGSQRIGPAYRHGARVRLYQEAAATLSATVTSEPTASKEPGEPGSDLVPSPLVEVAGAEGHVNSAVCQEVMGDNSPCGPMGDSKPGRYIGWVVPRPAATAGTVFPGPSRLCRGHGRNRWPWRQMVAPMGVAVAAEKRRRPRGGSAAPNEDDGVGGPGAVSRWAGGSGYGPQRSTADGGLAGGAGTWVVSGGFGLAPSDVARGPSSG